MPTRAPAPRDAPPRAPGAAARRALLDALDALPPAQRACVVLRFVRGLGVAETAASMGRSEAAIRALQYRAVRTLARRFPGDVPR